jgi:hypothetical protein
MIDLCDLIDESQEEDAYECRLSGSGSPSEDGSVSSSGDKAVNEKKEDNISSSGYTK